MYISGVSLSLCAGGQWGFQPGIFVFLMKESMKRRRKEPDKFMAKSCSQPVNLPGAQPLMNPLLFPLGQSSLNIMTRGYEDIDTRSLKF